jgi:hypothetical protein
VQHSATPTPDGPVSRSPATTTTLGSDVPGISATLAIERSSHHGRALERLAATRARNSRTGSTSAHGTNGAPIDNIASEDPLLFTSLEHARET